MGSIKGVRRGRYKKRTIKMEGKAICSECHKKYARKAILEHHIKSEHLKYRVNCPLCYKNFVSVSICNRHLKKVHGIQNEKTFNLNFEPQSIIHDVELSPQQACSNIPKELAIKTSKVFGNYVIATSDINIGQTIFVTDSFATIEIVSSKNLVCFTCGRKNDKNFLKCKHCINVYFCSKKCSLIETHKSKCNDMFTSDDCYKTRLATEMMLVALQSVKDSMQMVECCSGVLFLSTETRTCKPPFWQYGEILKLTSESEDEHVILAKKVCNYINISLQFKRDKLQRIQNILLHMARKNIACIGKHVFADECAIGIGGISTKYTIFDVISRINHSCAPNLHHFIDDKNKMRCVAVRPIKKGQQLFINYLPNFKETNENRRKEIKENWDFDCVCEKCSGDIDDTHNDGNETDEAYVFIKNNCNKVTKKKNIFIEQCISYLQRYGHKWTMCVQFIVVFDNFKLLIE